MHPTGKPTRRLVPFFFLYNTLQSNLIFQTQIYPREKRIVQQQDEPVKKNIQVHIHISKIDEFNILKIF